MLGRTLLPAFGGSAAVWTVCLAAYQLLLLAGYGYAHIIAIQSARTQRRLHLVLVAISVLWAFVFAALRLTLTDRLGASTLPSLEVLAGVLFIIGLPYVLLSAGSTLVQAWLARAETPKCGSAEVLKSPLRSHSFRTSREIYKLYAVSNLGSLSGLLAYPFLVEPFVSLDGQWYGFAAALLAYAALLAGAAKRSAPPPADDRSPVTDHRSPVTGHWPAVTSLPAPLAKPWLWFALPALSTFLLNAMTLHLSTDVTPVPMMWALLLTAFLGSYVIGFSSAGEKGLIVWAGLAAVILAGAAYAAGLKGSRAFLTNLSLCAGVILFGCTFLHGWLYRIRPETSKLTLFYLGIAAGGALGGVSASLAAPAVFDRVWEYPLALAAAAIACGWFVRTWNHPDLKGGLNGFLQIAAAATLFLVCNTALKSGRDGLLHTRNFYGCLRVSSSALRSTLGTSIPAHQLHHGGTLHGFQVRTDYLKDRPTTYYGIPGGGLALANHAKYTNGAPMRVGLIGLGVGTMACYGRTNDLYRFYEINPQVVAIARDPRWFSYLADSAAVVETVLGDARKNLEAERARGEPPYDVLVVDAYSGDSIPFHLATREAFALYRDRLAPGGILAVHVSNWHIDLFPLCKTMARAFDLHAVGAVSPQMGLLSAATWVFLTAEPLAFDLGGAREIDWDDVRDIVPPADERGSLIGLIRFNGTPPMKAIEIDLDHIM
jgi:hypothetical protein